MSKWQPIATAPQSDDDVLVYGGRYKKVTVVPADGDWWRAFPGKARPTHWMPLPDPPTSSDPSSPEETT